MSPSVHKILCHSVEVQQHLNFPHGMLSEGAGEAVHRRRKEIRDKCCRKTKRDDTNIDQLHRCLDESYPVVSTWYATQKNLFKKHEESRAALLPEARRLLIIDDDNSGSQGRPDANLPGTSQTRQSRKRKAPATSMQPKATSSVENDTVIRRITRSQQVPGSSAPGMWPVDDLSARPDP